MANRLLQILAEDYCCVAKFLEEEVMPYDSETAAEHLGVTMRTVQNYKSRYRNWNVYFCHKCYDKRLSTGDRP